jgi:enoyl-[acyl-carrier-protein] reductase (NADH)
LSEDPQWVGSRSVAGIVSSISATPRALAQEVAYLMRDDVMVTGEIRHVDGGYSMLA